MTKKNKKEKTDDYYLKNRDKIRKYEAAKNKEKIYLRSARNLVK